MRDGSFTTVMVFKNRKASNFRSDGQPLIHYRSIFGISNLPQSRPILAPTNPPITRFELFELVASGHGSSKQVRQDYQLPQLLGNHRRIGRVNGGRGLSPRVRTSIPENARQLRFHAANRQFFHDRRTTRHRGTDLHTGQVCEMAEMARQFRCRAWDPMFQIAQSPNTKAEYASFLSG